MIQFKFLILLISLIVSQVSLADETPIPGTLISNGEVAFYLVPNPDSKVPNTVEARRPLFIARKAAIYASAAAGLTVMVKVLGPGVLKEMGVSESFASTITNGVSLAGIFTGAGKLIYDFQHHPQFAAEVVDFARANATSIPTILIDSDQFTDTLHELADIGFTPVAESVALN